MSSLTPFQEKIAIAWAVTCMVKFDVQNPSASPAERSKVFCDAVEGGLSLAYESFEGC